MKNYISLMSGLLSVVLIMSFARYGADKNGHGHKLLTAAKMFRYVKLATDGDWRGMFFIGNHFCEKNTKNDYSKARIWYLKAAEKGHTGSMNNLGIIYMEGYIDTVDYPKAKYWFERSLEADSANFYAKANLGFLLAVGYHDHKNARRLIDEALAKRPKDLSILYKKMRVQYMDGDKDGFRQTIREMNRIDSLYLPKVLGAKKKKG